MDNFDYTLWAQIVVLLCSISATMIVSQYPIMESDSEADPQPALPKFLTMVLEEWPAKRRQRLALKELTDEALIDIGVSRSQATNEAAKPFWR
ncbi:DUF1127 domain-containing protein [Agrobacterium tumefaciens]|uniref:DUF1127 domain-containing protein n=1 Tax=Agrobacterium tumefaciens TaxID=358 RepID=UPI001F43917C